MSIVGTNPTLAMFPPKTRRPTGVKLGRLEIWGSPKAKNRGVKGYDAGSS